MAAAIDEKHFYKISTILRVSSPLITSNRPSFVNKHYPGDCYALLTIDESKNQLKGSVCWANGGSGFDFTVNLEPNKSGGLDIVFTKLAHTSNWTNADDLKTDKIIEDFIKFSSAKMDNIFNGIKEPFNSANMTGYYFRKKRGRSGTKPSQKFHSNLGALHSSKVITNQFYNFVVNNSEKIVIAKY